MNISINETVLDKYNLSVEEFLTLYLCLKEVNIEETINKLISKGFAERNIYNNIAAVVSNNVKELAYSILIESDKEVVDKDEEFTKVAEELRSIFPEGRKAGTNYYWRDNTATIARKLKTLVAKFNFHFTKEQAIVATKEYVKSFNGDYQYMQLLKYFILKTEGDSIRSEFMSLIENAGQHDDKGLNDEWLNEMR